MDDGQLIVKHDILEHSPDLKEIAAALALAQAKVRGATKDSENPHFKSSYADLASVWDACRDAITSNGLSVVQAPGKDSGDVVVVSLMLHKSGQWIKCRSSATPMKNDAQAFGSATTYLRRYALAAMTGVAPEDDDGEAASGRGQAGPKSAPANNDRAPSQGSQNGQARTAAPQNNADAEWKKEAERIKKEIQSASTADSLDKFIKGQTTQLNDIKAHSQTAYDHLMKCATQRNSDLMQAA